MPGNYPFVGNAQTFLNDFAINNANPAVEYGGTEANALYYEDREIAGAMYRVQNATYNKIAGSWVAINTAAPVYAWVMKADGSLSLLYAAAGVSPITTWTTKWSLPAASLAPGVFNPYLYGLVWDGVTDDAAHIQAAINAASAAGGGIVPLPAGTGAFGTKLILPANVTLIGAGMDVTILKAMGAAQSGVQIGNGTTKQKNITLANLSIQASSNTSSGTGLTLVLSGVNVIQNVHIIDFPLGISQATSPNSIFENVLASYSGTAVATLWALDGSSGGNVSSVYRDCTAAATAAANVSTIGLSIFSSAANGDSGDLNFFNFNTTYCPTAVKVNFANVQPYSDTSSDIIFRDSVLDLFTTYGFQILGGDNSSIVKIEGGFFNPATSGATDVIGVYSSARTVILTGAEFLPVATSFGHNAFATQIAGGDAVISACSFNGWTRGAYVNGGKATITANRFYSTPDGGSGIGIAMNSVQVFNSTGTIIDANTFSATATNGMLIGIYLDSTAVNCIATSNEVSSANIQSKFINNSTTSFVAHNIGYNPLGKGVTQPAVPASAAAAVNTYGVGVDVYVTGGTVSNIQRKDAAGNLISVASSTASIVTVHLEPGEAIVPTYTVAPTWTWVGY